MDAKDLDWSNAESIYSSVGTSLVGNVLFTVRPAMP